MQFILGQGGLVNLQGTLAATSADGTLPTPAPHHPITCATTLTYDEDGSLACAHTRVPPEDVRLQMCLNHTVAILLIEEASHA